MAKTVRQALKGRGDFISDIYTRDMLYGATVRCPFARASIRSISRHALPEDAFCITAREIPGRNALCVDGETMPLLARDECHYLGEPVAVVAGPSQRAVISAMRTIDIDYEERAPKLSFVPPAPSQVIARETGERGDVEAALSASANRVEGIYRTEIQEHLYNEPQGAVALFDEGRLVIRSATQWPFHVRETVAACLDRALEDVVVRPADPGIALDGKLWYPSIVAAHAAMLASATGRPVKLVYSNIEDFRFTPKRAPFVFHYVTGVTEEGRLSAVDIDVTFNAGAYGLFTREICDRVIAAVMMMYDCRDVRVRVVSARTNLPPLNVLSGFGSSSALFATETHVTRVAEIASIDPLTWRRANLAAGSTAGGASGGTSGGASGGTSGGKRTGRSRVERVLEPVARESDFSRKFAAYELQKKRRAEFAEELTPTHGIGIAVGAQGAGFLGAAESLRGGTVVVRLQSDGSAVLRTSAVPGSRIVIARWRGQIAEILGLDPSNVQVENADTAGTPDSGPSTLSRNVAMVSRLIDQACNAIQKKRFRSPLPIEVRRSSRAQRARGYDARTLSGTPFPRASYGAAVVEVGVDPVTFESRVQTVWLAVDAGRILDETEARRALEMSVYQAVEWATHEIITFRDGAIDPRSYLSYRNVSEPALPQLHITLLHSKDADPEGLGELPQSCVPAALAAAVSQATGRYMDQIPTNPALIHAYLESE